jgi:potassium/hydrogen antiporter
VPDAQRLFELVFFVVVVNAVVQGLTIRPVAKWLRLESDAPPPPPALLEVSAARPLRSEVLHFYVSAASAVSGSTIAEVPFPEGSNVMLVVRGDDLVPARGPTALHPGDHVYVYCRPEDREFLHLVFGQEEES